MITIEATELHRNKISPKITIYTMYGKVVKGGALKKSGSLRIRIGGRVVVLKKLWNIDVLSIYANGNLSITAAGYHNNQQFN